MRFSIIVNLATLKLRGEQGQVTSLFTVLEKIKHLAELTATSLGKSVRIIFPNADSEIPDHWQLPLTLALTHIVRNSIDHGLRDQPGEIRFQVPPQPLGMNWVLEIEDNGQGVDFEKIKARGIDLGLIESNDAPSRNALLELLFYPGFSTQKDPNEYSGRGIGMDIIRHEIVKLGGHVHLTQLEKKGLQVRIEIRQDWAPV